MVRVEVEIDVEVAWRSFGHRLTAELVELAEGRGWRVEVPIGRGGRSPVELVVRRRPKTFQVAAVGSPPVGGAGSAAPAEPPTGVPRTRVFRAGAEAELPMWLVGVLRTAYEVVHPAFLRTAPTGSPYDTTSRPEAVGWLTSADQADPRAATGLTIPTSPDQLDDLVERSLAGWVPGPLLRDSDGDIPLRGEHGVAYVRVRRDRPVVEVFAPLGRPPAGTSALTHANQHNASATFAKFVVVHGWIVVQVAIWCQPYVPSELIRAIDEVMAVLVGRAGESDDVGDGDDEVDEDEVDGIDEDEEDRYADDECHSDGGNDVEVESELEPELLTIRQLDEAERGSVSPHLAAKIYGYDRDKLLAGILASEEHMLRWFASIEEARESDPEEADVCAGEWTTWQATVDLLRAALRVAVEL